MLINNFDVNTVIKGIKSTEFYDDQIVFEKDLTESSGESNSLPDGLSIEIRKSLKKQGIKELFTHQRDAIDKILAGRSCVISSPAASGKSECYNIPIIDSMVRDPNSCALYLFPMNALMRDQLNKIIKFDERWKPGHKIDINSWLGNIRIGAAEIWYGRYIYEKYTDGFYEEGAKTRARREIRDVCNILFTNGDMLHIGILPHHRKWKRFFRNLKYVVIDEIHSYKGAWGSHFANVLRRLGRICAHYGSNPSFICTSATIGNPEELSEKIVGTRAESIRRSGAPIRRKKIVFWKPKGGIVNEVSNLVCHLINQRYRTIVFGKSQNICKLISRRVRQNLGRRQAVFRYYGADLPDDERREIESYLKDGSLLGIASTNAMELGIDIGDLNVCLLVGYPGSIASFWQRAGRVGRTGQGLIVMMGVNDPIVQYIMRHPRELLSKPVEQIVLNPDNERVLKSHIWQANREVPINEKDTKIFGKDVKKFVKELQMFESMEYEPESDEDKWYWELTHSQHPPEKINIRNPLSKFQFDIIDERGDKIGKMDNHSAIRKLHPRAVYIKDDTDYLVKDLSFYKRIALVESVPEKLDYYTHPLIEYNEKIKNVVERKKISEMDVYFGGVKVTETVLKYKERKFDVDEESLIKQRPISIPWGRVPIEVIETTAIWFTIPIEILNVAKKQDNVSGGLHAIEHAMIPMLAYCCSCDREEIGGLSIDYHEDTGQATIFIHDAHPGGYGYAKRGYEIFDDLIAMTLNQIDECRCRTGNGCPNCIQDVHCGNNNEPLDKKAAIQILEHLKAGKS